MEKVPAFQGLRREQLRLGLLQYSNSTTAGHPATVMSGHVGPGVFAEGPKLGHFPTCPERTACPLRCWIEFLVRSEDPPVRHLGLARDISLGGGCLSKPAIAACLASDSFCS